MSDQTDNEQFAVDLEQRFQDLMQWAITSWPDAGRPISVADFDDAKEAVHKVAQRVRHSGGEALAPSEGGAQFVSVAPTPWP